MTAAIALDDIHHAYAGRPALAGLSLTVGPGEVFALLGANGGGKTTALKIMAGMLQPDRGTGRILDLPLRDSRAVRARIGYMAQGLALAPHLNVAETLRFRAALYHLDDSGGRIARMIDRFGLGPHTDTRVAALSGGWARRLHMACCLLHGPSVVLLDEPTTGLDAVARQQLWLEIGRLADAGAAVVIATHDHHEAAWAGRGLFLIDGVTALSGRPADMAAAAPGVVLQGPVAASIDTLTALTGVLGGRRDGTDVRLYVRDGAAERIIGHHPGLTRRAPSLADAAYLTVATHESRRQPEMARQPKKTHDKGVA